MNIPIWTALIGELQTSPSGFHNPWPTLFSLSSRFIELNKKNNFAVTIALAEATKTPSNSKMLPPIYLEINCIQYLAS